MEKNNQNLESVKKAKGNLVSLTVKDVAKIKAGARLLEKKSK